MPASPIQKVSFREIPFYIKRDDLFVASADISSGSSPDIFEGLKGNKGRKLHYYLSAELPEISRIVSYGSAQSNMLYSLSCLAALRGWHLDFYVDHIASSLSSSPHGNYAAALKNGARIHAVGERVGGIRLGEYVEALAVAELKVGEDPASLFIPEGGRSALAEEGVKQLAEEINAWVMENNIPNPKVMLPSGTGTSALYLQKHLSFEVLTCACVGSDDYLRQQFARLCSDSARQPRILPKPDDASGKQKKYHFGKCYPEFYAIWQQLEQETGIRFELLYDPLGWLCLMDYVGRHRIAGKTLDESLIYIHQGGILGNESMLGR